MIRSIGLMAALAVLASACSGGDSTAAPSSTSVASSEQADTVPDTVVTTTSPATTVPPPDPDLVTIAIAAPELDVAVEVSAPADDSADPFDAFATCSAYRAVTGAYSVGVGQPDALTPWVSVVTTSRIDGAGEFEADVRLELPNGDAISAIGTLDLDADLASGSFEAVSATGMTIDGSFECAGSDGPPLTMTGSDAGAIEIVALVERGDRERVVTAATVGSNADDCPVIAGDHIVRVDGDDDPGSIRSFELHDNPASLHMQVGGTTFEFDDATVVAHEETRSGTFSAADGTTTVTGAYICT